MILRPALAGDAADMATIHAQSFESPWSASEIAILLASPGGFGFAVAEQEALSGFILCRLAADEAEILTLATRTHRRRRGVAAVLLRAVRGAVTAAGAQAIFLEVAADNLAALALYEGQGFVRIGERRGYYERRGSAPMSALVWRLDLNR